ncbi:MAG TPA: lipoyl(octanoyl) transferase LipB [Thermoplasmata archaeon]|nr:lipoyl(octanoyl) transferase LipB [Thermoplasmata archaeon]
MSPGGVPLPALLDWGTREYGRALDSMRALRRERAAGRIPDTLILVEHPPVYTVGVQGLDGETLPADVPVFHVERGGKGTFHGPGQLVGYPIVDLSSRGRDVRRFVHDVEELVVRAVASVGVEAGRVPGRRGVWVGGERKLASVGIAIEEWVTFHGFALNVNVDLAPFHAFHPCGFDGQVMTTVEREVGRPISCSALQEPVRRAWAELFGEPEGAFLPTLAVLPSPSA